MCRFWLFIFGPVLNQLAAGHVTLIKLIFGTFQKSSPTCRATCPRKLSLLYVSSHSDTSEQQTADAWLTVPETSGASSGGQATLVTGGSATRNARFQLQVDTRHSGTMIYQSYMWLDTVLTLLSATSFKRKLCLTKDDPPKACQFPYMLEGNEITTCTNQGGQLMCPTQLESNGKPKQGSWSECKDNCEAGVRIQIHFTS